MEGLYLKAGGALEQVRWIYDQTAAQGEYVPFDVGNRAIEFLFQPVKLADDLRLRDVFLLVQRNPELLRVLRRDWAEELLAEALQGEAKPYTGEYDPEGIEFLELYAQWNYNSQTTEYTGISRLDFHGVGYELREDVKQGDWVVHVAGSRVQWGISFSPLGELLDIPLRLSPEVLICEDDTASGQWGCKVAEAVCFEVTLGQVLHGVFWELSFNGGPADRQQRRDELMTACEAAEEHSQGAAT